MPTAQSKEASRAPAVSDEERRAAERCANLLCVSTLLSLSQHIIAVQTEPRLVLELCKGNGADAARLLGNTSGLVGLLSMVLNQAGGKLSDSVGRKAGFMVGPTMNMFLGYLVYKHTSNKLLVTVCRVLRLICTTFSNTVMIDAAMADLHAKGISLEKAKAKVMLWAGASMLITPFLETVLLRRGMRYVYLALSGLAVTHTIFNLSVLPETLPPEQRRRGTLTLETINPFGFVRVFAEGSRALWQLTLLTTFQMFLEGKNVSDIAQTWVREDLKWTMSGIRNFVVIYGILTTLAASHMAPWLRSQFNAKDFTTLTNGLNAFGFLIRGLKASTPLWLFALIPMLPGVNGTCAIPLKSRATTLADAEGFGKGEYSAWSNNLRAVVGAAAPMLYGQIWAGLKVRGLNPGYTFAFAGVVGAIIPQAMLWMMTDRDLGVDDERDSKNAKAK